VSCIGRGLHLSDHSGYGRRALRAVRNFLGRLRGSGRLPEWSIVGWGFPLNAAWEFAQSPLYADWDRPWVYLLWTRLHCTVGDVMILLGAFWLTSLVFGTRRWIGTKHGGALLFVLLGIGYTTWSEWLNTSVRVSWSYGAAMPVIFGIGLAPLLQWILPPLVLWLSRPRASQRTSTA
jgi:hypothetical protein